MYESPSSILDLFARQPLDEAAVAFLPVWLLALFAGFRVERAGDRGFDSRFRRLDHLRRAGQGSIYVVVLLWAAVAAFRSFSFFEQLAYSHGPDSREFFAIAVWNMGAGAVTCCLLSVALSLRSQPAWRLGLRATPYLVSVLVLFGALLDAAFQLAVTAFYSQPSTAGIPLPISLVS